MLLWCTYTHSKCQSYDILNVPFKGESQLNLSQGCTVRLLILGRLSSKQIYVVERWGQRMWQGLREHGEIKRDRASPLLIRELHREIYMENKGLLQCQIIHTKGRYTQDTHQMLHTKGKQNSSIKMTKSTKARQDEWKTLVVRCRMQWRLFGIQS